LRNPAGNTVMPKPPDEDALPPSIDQVFSLIYEQLHHIASSVRRNEAHQTLNSTALVHEAWLRLKDSPELAATTPAHFKGIAACVMRQVLVDAARQRNAVKRGGPGAVRVPLDDWFQGMGVFDPALDAEVLALHEALGRLANMDARQAKVVELRVFSELTIPEIACEVDAGVSTVERDWRAARAWLKTQLVVI
jgi:RNA polymerase sigma factor (TIGR02999 family)